MLSVHQPVGVAGRTEAGNTLRLTRGLGFLMLSSPGGRKARRESPACSRAAGYIPGLPTIKPQSRVRENGLHRVCQKLRQLLGMAPTAVLTSSVWFWFSYMLHTSKAANVSRHHPNQDKLAHR